MSPPQECPDVGICITNTYSCGYGGGVIAIDTLCEPQWNTWFQHRVEAWSKCGKHNGEIETVPGKRDAAFETADRARALPDLTFWVLHSGGIFKYDQVMLWTFSNSLNVSDEMCNCWFLDGAVRSWCKVLPAAKCCSPVSFFYLLRPCTFTLRSFSHDCVLRQEFLWNLCFNHNDALRFNKE